MKVKDIIKGSPTSLPLNPSLPLNSEMSAHLSTYWEAKDRETRPQEIQNGRTASVKGQFPAKVPPQAEDEVAGTC